VSGRKYLAGPGDSYFQYIRLRPGVKIDVEKFNARLDAAIQNYIPQEEKESVGYTAVIQPIREVYLNSDTVKSMISIMSLLGFAILFIAALNYVLISVSSLSYRAKAVGVHNVRCFGCFGFRYVPVGNRYHYFTVDRSDVLLLINFVI
jgi:putative ABC transport system permease protein